MIKLLHIDCMEYMATVPDKYFSLCIVDPPYGIKQDGHRENNRSKLARSKKYHKAIWDQSRPSLEYFKELKRISVDQIIWGANHLADLFNVKSSCWIVWTKKVIGSKGSNFADCELAYTSFNTAVRSFEFEWQGMIQGDMKNKEHRIHPTQKPVQLYKWILTNYAKPTDKIIDTHLGSGSSAIAAYDFGVAEFVGCEIDEEYYNAAKKRFEIHIQQQQIKFE